VQLAFDIHQHRVRDSSTSFEITLMGLHFQDYACLIHVDVSVGYLVIPTIWETFKNWADHVFALPHF
jgi:hypothetical protein